MQPELLLGLYIVFFAVIHSLTAATSFKNSAYRFVDPKHYRFIYSIFSLLTVIPIIYLWFWNRNSSPILYKEGFPLAYFSIIMAAFGAILILASFVVIDVFEFIGLKGLSGRKTKEAGLVTMGVYGFVRHPLYLGGMLILWSNPYMRLLDFTVALLFSLYLVLGAILEERKLVEEFGQGYLEYKKSVSMFLPWKWIKTRFQSLSKG